MGLRGGTESFGVLRPKDVPVVFRPSYAPRSTPQAAFTGALRTVPTPRAESYTYGTEPGAEVGVGVGKNFTLEWIYVRSQGSDPFPCARAPGRPSRAPTGTPDPGDPGPCLPPSFLPVRRVSEWGRGVDDVHRVL